MLLSPSMNISIPRSHSVYTLPPIDSLPSPPMQLHSIDIDQHDVYEALVKLDIRKAMGDNTQGSC